MLVVAVLSAFMSNTGAVAIFIPLIGTPPNLAVSTELSRAGMEPFNFFSFTPIGLAVLVAAIAFILLFGPALLPTRGPQAESHSNDSRRRR